MTFSYVDVHAHVSFDAFDADREAVLEGMRAKGIAAITVGVNAASSQKAVACAEGHEHIFASVGLHPNETLKESFEPESYAALIRAPRVVSVGECGLDYYRNDPADAAMRKRQREALERQIEFAIAHEKPLMLHCRPSRGTMDAYEDVLSILAVFPRSRGNVHFFVGMPKLAERFFESDFTISFTGVITFARDYDETIRAAPASMIHVETDSPYVAPRPHRGGRNDPRSLPIIVAELARVRAEAPQDLAPVLVENARRVFGIGETPGVARNPAL